MNYVRMDEIFEKRNFIDGEYDYKQYHKKDDPDCNCLPCLFHDHDELSAYCACTKCESEYDKELYFIKYIMIQACRKNDVEVFNHYYNKLGYNDIAIYPFVYASVAINYKSNEVGIEIYNKMETDTNSLSGFLYEAIVTHNLELCLNILKDKYKYIDWRKLVTTLIKTKNESVLNNRIQWLYNGVNTMPFESAYKFLIVKDALVVSEETNNIMLIDFFFKQTCELIDLDKIHEFINSDPELLQKHLCKLIDYGSELLRRYIFGYLIKNKLNVKCKCMDLIEERVNLELSIEHCEYKNKIYDCKGIFILLSDYL